MSKTTSDNFISIQHNFYIKFYPGLNSSIGNEKATLILGRLEYWFEKYTHGFYKFIEPCKHPTYKEGDSWFEELGFPRKAFTKAFDLIGVRYKSKTAFLRAKDKFQGKLYASYHDRKTNQTFFIRNHEFASQFLKSLFKRKTSSSVSKSKKMDINLVNTSKNNEFSLNSRSRSGQDCRSYGGIIGGRKYKLIQKNTSSLEFPQQKPDQDKSDPSQTKLTEEMMRIWKEEIGELGISNPTESLFVKLNKSFQQFFNNSLDSWRSYCQTIASSKFLMGEAQNKFFKKAWITWAIQKEAIERIRGGGFKLGDRETKLDKQINEIDQTLAALKAEKEAIESRIQSINDSLKRERLQKTRGAITSLSKTEVETLKTDFEKQLEAENNAISEQFKKSGWRGQFVSTYFDVFLREDIEARLYATSLEEEANHRLQESGIHEELSRICHELNKLREIRKSLVRSKELGSTIKPFS